MCFYVSHDFNLNYLGEYGAMKNVSSDVHNCKKLYLKTTVLKKIITVLFMLSVEEEVF